MAYSLSSAQAARLQSVVDSKTNALKNWKKRMAREEKLDQMWSIGEAVGSASVVGFLRGKFEDANGEWRVFNTPMDWEMVIGLAPLLSGIAGAWGRYDKHMVNIGNGILAHYSGQLTRKWAKTGSFTLAAGDYGSLHGGMPSVVGAGHPALGVGSNWDPVSFNATQISAPYDDPVAMALAQSGI